LKIKTSFLIMMLSHCRRRFLHIVLAAVAFSAYSSAASLVSPTAPVVVAGAGPASLVFVAQYLQLNPTGNIILYEKRPRPPTYSQSAHDDDDNETGFGAFGFGLGGRAQGLLAKVPGLLEPVKSVAFMFAGGRLMFVNQRDMCAEMICVLEKEYGLDGQRLKVVFESQVCGVNDDFTVNVTTSSKSGEETQECVPYSLLVAGDGTNSVIRQSLVDAKEIRCKRYLRNVGWKALQLPRQASLSPGFASFKNKKWTYGAMLPRFKDRSVLLMFWPKGKTYGNNNPFNANSPEKLRVELSEIFPNITAFPSDTVLQEFLDERPGRETFMKLNKHASPDRRIALLGDAAVGVYSLMGQGIASSTERAILLAEAVCSSNSVDNDQMIGISEALRSFSDESVREGHAITDLNLIAHAMSVPLIGRFAPWGGKMNILLQNPDVPYSDIRKRYQGWVRLSRLLWFFARVPMSD
jgi:2-polyprenyl-6-methoxyphenol hydroxylase-like FAD-dependent oxidoreductase